MEYSVSDFYDCLIELDVDPKTISKVHYVWGDISDDGWEGGFCVENVHEEYSIIRRNLGEVIIFEDLEKDMCVPPNNEEFIKKPYDINCWLDDGAPITETHMY